MTSADPLDADGLQRLWTPWRMSYIRGNSEHAGRCPFCVLPAAPEADDVQNLILYRGESAYVILNAYPYNPGHLMVVPYRHVAGLEDVAAEELRELATLTQRAVGVLKETTAPTAYNIGMNLGTVAGAGIADHLHQHVVPRWAGDTNFMPVVGHTRVLPELLVETYERLAPAFRS